MRHECFQCDALAVWYYAPVSIAKMPAEHYLCEEHVPRGCAFCNTIDTADIGNPSAPQFTDDQGRLLPCFEWEFYELGFKVV